MNGVCGGGEKRGPSSSLSPPGSPTASVPCPVRVLQGENCESNGEDGSPDAPASSLSASAGGDEGELKSPPRLAAYLKRRAAHSGRPWVDAVITDPPYGKRYQMGVRSPRARLGEGAFQLLPCDAGDACYCSASPKKAATLLCRVKRAVCVDA